MRGLVEVSVRDVLHRQIALQQNTSQKDQTATTVIRAQSQKKLNKPVNKLINYYLAYLGIFLYVLYFAFVDTNTFSTCLGIDRKALKNNRAEVNKIAGREL